MNEFYIYIYNQEDLNMRWAGSGYGSTPQEALNDWYDRADSMEPADQYVLIKSDNLIGPFERAVTFRLVKTFPQQSRIEEDLKPQRRWTGDDEPDERQRIQRELEDVLDRMPQQSVDEPDAGVLGG